MPHEKNDGLMQRVTEAHLRPFTSILMKEQDPHRKSHYWQLDLACGHTIERRIRWEPRADGSRHRGWAAFSPSLSRLPEPPKRARCSEAI